MSGKRVRCSDCDGGFFHGNGKCSHCHGSGVNLNLASDLPRCVYCDGTGECATCKGTGLHPYPEDDPEKIQKLFE